jgi:hypothetical protein
MPLSLEEERERQRVKARRWYQKPANRAQRLAYMKKHRLDNLEAYQARHRKWRAGWTADQFAAAWEAQAGACNICGIAMRPTGRKGDSVTADHDHTTGKSRALLCRICNSRLAALESRVWKAKAEAYLLRHAGAVIPDTAECEAQ